MKPAPKPAPVPERPANLPKCIVCGGEATFYKPGTAPGKIKLAGREVLIQRGERGVAWCRDHGWKPAKRDTAKGEAS